MGRLKIHGICNCGNRHIVNGHRRSGAFIAMWKCPEHGNVFDERKSDVTLTDIQERVLNIIKRRGGAGNITTDEVSRTMNLSMAVTERAIAVLSAAGYI